MSTDESTSTASSDVTDQPSPDGHLCVLRCYRSSLEGGIDPAESVDEQLKYHEVPDSAHENVGKDFDHDSRREHSNVHVGEQFYDTDPIDDDRIPSTEISVEVDLDKDVPATVDSPRWRDRIERNFRVYSIDTDVRYHDREVTDKELGNLYCGRVKELCIYYTSPYDWTDLYVIAENHHNLDTDYYMFVGEKAADVDDTLFPEQSGVSYISGTAIFVDGHPEGGLSPGTLQTRTTKTAVNEIGHKLSIGEEDDEEGEPILQIPLVIPHMGTATIVVISAEETYSGCTYCDIKDSTIENITDSQGSIRSEWRIMSSGTSSDQYAPPVGDTYVPFSIEELLSLEIPDN
jgi:hypothetical protein